MSEGKSKLEVVAGSTATGLAAAAVAAFNPENLPSMSMVYALLPVLVNSLARARADKRLSEWLAEVDTRLRLLGDHINRFSDAQYRLTVGIIQTAFETIDGEKLRMLKAAVLNIANSDYLEHFHAQVFSRILRDVSAAEISLLAKYRDAPGFTFRMIKKEESDRVLAFNPTGAEAIVIRGLINLGLVVRAPTEGTYGDVAQYITAPFVPQLLELVAEQ